jgi:hypothetical protein
LIFSALSGLENSCHTGVMPKRLSKPKRSSDPNVAAFQIVNKIAESSDEVKPTRSEISRIMSAMGRKGGKKSAKSRMALLTPEERSGIALKAAKARWAMKQKGPIEKVAKLK